MDTKLSKEEGIHYISTYELVKEIGNKKTSILYKKITDMIKFYI